MSATFAMVLVETARKAKTVAELERVEEYLSDDRYHFTDSARSAVVRALAHRLDEIVLGGVGRTMTKEEYETIMKPEYECCPRCRGAGRIKKSTWLSPEDDGGSQRIVERANKLGAVLPIERNDFLVVGAASIYEACQEGLKLAKASGVPSVFDFNERIVIVHPFDDASAVARAWWISAYKETPEESMARR